MKVGKAKIGASVKADAYGLGAVPIGRALYGAGCRIFFVATAGEGKILLINSLAQADFWASAIKGMLEPPYTAIHIDTGMNRLGFSAEEFEIFRKQERLWKTLHPEWVMSHLACAPDKSHPKNAAQLAKFKKAAAQLPISPLSLANTAGIYLGQAYHFQMVRPGIGLYGGYATTDPAQENVRPVATLLAAILQIRNVSKGDTLGYNASYTAPRNMRVAVVGAGYADGIPVSAQDQAYATLHDQRVPIVGRVSMDLTMLDVTDVNLPFQVGGVVAFRGDQLQADADNIGTLNYELLTRLGQRCRRDYI